MSDKLFAWSVVADKTDVTIPFRLISTAGAAVTGKVATNLTLSYWRQGGTRTAISASDLAAVNSSHSDGGVKEVDSTNFPGVYRLDLPDAAVANGADWVCVGVVCSGAVDYETWLPIQSSGTVEIYSRIGAPAGASVSADIAALPSASTIATAVWAAATRTLTGFGTLVADVWAYATRTLTQSAAAVAAAVAGSTITIRRGDTVTIALTGLGSLASRTQIWLTLKADLSRDDSAAAVVQIAETGGLLYLNGAAADTAADGSLTVTDANAGNISIVLKHGATKLLSAPNTMQYDIQILYASGTITTLTAGTANVVEDVTKRVS